MLFSDVVRNNYQSFLDANYALAQTHASNAALGSSCSRLKEDGGGKEGLTSTEGAAAAAVTSWSKNAEWNFQQGQTDGSNTCFGPSQYHQNSVRNYWT